MKLDFYAATDPGRVRATNQDAVLAWAPGDGRFALFAVADGVGGLARGAEASQLAVNRLRATAQQPASGEPMDSIVAALHEANTEIIAASPEAPMATTIVVAVIGSTGVEIAHAGDSRAYLFRDGALSPLTNDHTWVADQVRAGLMTATEAANSNRRNVITRCLGSADRLDLERQAVRAFGPRDCLLLSSDGLHGVVSSAEISSLLGRAATAQETAERLVARANERGGPDNIAVVVVRAIESRSP